MQRIKCEEQRVGLAMTGAGRDAGNHPVLPFPFWWEGKQGLEADARKKNIDLPAGVEGGPLGTDGAEFQGCTPVLETSTKPTEGSPSPPRPFRRTGFASALSFLGARGGFLPNHFPIPSSGVGDRSLCLSGGYAA